MNSGLRTRLIADLRVSLTCGFFMRLTIVVSLFFTLFISGCAQTSIKDYSQQENVALVIIGFKGNIAWNTVTSTDVPIHSYEFPNSKVEDVVLMPVTVGTRFQILELAHEKKGNKDQDYSFKLIRTPMLNIYKDKIYYYGVVHSFVSDEQHSRSKIVTDIDQSIIEQTKRKYPDIFARKPDIQFKNDDLTADMLERKEIDYENTSRAKYLKSLQKKLQR